MSKVNNIKGGVTVINKSESDVQKAESGVLGSNSFAPEDAFTGLYYSVGKSSIIIAPPYIPSSLMQLVPKNNTLNQCITAMEVNIDGTGAEIVPETADTKDDEKRKGEIEAFFKEPYPEVSMVTMRRELRRDLEITGNAYIEVLRNIAGEVIFIRRVPSLHMRICRLSKPVTVPKTVIRAGKEFTVNVSVRERPYAQMVGSRVVYFREFNSSRKLDKTSGEWAAKGKKLSASKEATEVIHLTVIKDSLTPYGIPRWVNQTPSVLGSRKAEVHNLDFFDSGGLPPVLITVSGGQMIEGTRKALESYLNGSKDKHRAAIVEAYTSGGAVGSAGNVKINVEQFGSAKVNDSMFENYDERCEERVRGSFRLPPIFVGKALAYNFATAQASYLVAEAQVFEPEREEFDTIMNVTLMKALGADGLVYKSNPIKSNNVDSQLKAIGMASGNGVTKQSTVDALNGVADLNLEFDEQQAKAEQNAAKALADAANKQAVPPQGGQPVDPNANPTKKKPPKGASVKNTNDKVKKADGFSILELADKWAAVAEGEHDFSQDELLVMKGTIENYTPSESVMFYNTVAAKVFPGMKEDPAGAMEMVECLADMNCGCPAH